MREALKQAFTVDTSQYKIKIANYKINKISCTSRVLPFMDKVDGVNIYRTFQLL